MKDLKYYKESLITDSLEGEVMVTWLGTAGMHISDGKSSFFIDPFVSRYSLIKVFGGFKLASRAEVVADWIDRCGGQKAAAVIVSHSHYDHCLDAPSFAAQTGAFLAGSESTAWVGRSEGLPEEQIRVFKPGDSFDVGDFSITFIESRHGPAVLGRIPFPGTIAETFKLPAPATKYKLGTTFSLHIKHPAGTMIHHGSAGNFLGMYDGLSTDVMFLGIGGRGNTQEYIRDVPEIVSPSMLIPVHFDDMFSPLDKKLGLLPRIKLAEFIETAGEMLPEAEIRTLPVGKQVAIF